MSDLVEKIDAFLAKYPDDAELVWRESPAAQRRRVDPALQAVVAEVANVARLRDAMTITNAEETR